jgi:hypothetical protein
MSVIALLTTFITAAFWITAIYYIYTWWLVIYPYLKPVFKVLGWIFEQFTSMVGIISGMSGVLTTIYDFMMKMFSEIESIALTIADLPMKIVNSVTDFVMSLIDPINSAIDSLKSGGGLWCDIRIKENINTTDNKDILDKLNQIPIKEYNYKDKKMYKGEKVQGVIAQEVKEIIPEAVNIDKGFLPNIYKNADKVQIVMANNLVNTDIIILPKLDKIKPKIKRNKPIEYNLIIDINYDVKLEKGMKIKIIVDEDIIIAPIIDFTPSSITVAKWYTYDKNKSLFVYGTEIDDFHYIDKGYLGILCIAGIQEICKKIKETNNDIQERLLKLEKTL